MGPYNYSPPSQQQPEQDPNNQWFNALPGEPLPEQKPSRSKKPIIVAAAAVTLLLISTTLGVLLTRPTAAACLTTDDYAALTGKPFEDSTAFSPSDSFYSASIGYENGKASWLQDQQAENEKVIKNIARFYENRLEEDKSVVITVDAGYTKNDTEEAAQERIAMIIAEFNKYGIDASIVKTNDVKEIEAGEELTDDSPELMQATAHITVTSDQTCQV